jgi:hypothetical protein
MLAFFQKNYSSTNVEFYETGSSSVMYGTDISL